MNTSVNMLNKAYLYIDEMYLVTAADNVSESMQNVYAEKAD